MDSAVELLVKSAEIRGLILTFISGLLAILVALLAWIGNRVHSRLDEISKSLGSIDKDLRESITHVDRRVARLEGLSGMHMNQRRSDKEEEEEEG